MGRQRVRWRRQLERQWPRTAARASGGDGSWSAKSNWGGTASGGDGSWSAKGAEGGTASGGDGSWHAQGNDGGTASGGDGSWHAQGAEGGTASGGDGSWHADGAYGGTAQGGGGSWTATSPYGATAYHNDNYYGGAYSTYHPPTTVNYYNNTCGGCGGWGAAGAAAAGMAVGASRRRRGQCQCLRQRLCGGARGLFDRRHLSEHPGRLRLPGRAWHHL